MDTIASPAYGFIIRLEESVTHDGLQYLPDKSIPFSQTHWIDKDQWSQRKNTSRLPSTTSMQSQWIWDWDWKRHQCPFLCVVSGFDTEISSNIFSKLSFSVQRFLFWTSRSLIFSAIAVFPILTSLIFRSASCSLFLRSMLAVAWSLRCVMTCFSRSEEWSLIQELSLFWKACHWDWAAILQLEASCLFECWTS